MKANYVCKEKDRGIADYAYCVDDDIAIIDDDLAIIDDDETVCDDDRDGLTPEEAEAYNEECKMLRELSSRLIGLLGWSGYKKWCNSLYP